MVLCRQAARSASSWRTSRASKSTIAAVAIGLNHTLFLLIGALLAGALDAKAQTNGPGTALSFSSTNSYVIASNAPNVGLFYTIEGWLKIDSMPTQDVNIIHWGNTSGPYPWFPHKWIL